MNGEVNGSTPGLAKVARELLVHRLPSSIVNNEKLPQHKTPDFILDHPHAGSLSEIYSRRVLSHEIKDDDGQITGEVALVRKKRPYVMTESPDMMVLYFGDKQIVTLGDFDQFFDHGRKYLEFVVRCTKATISVMGDELYSLFLSTNCAPFSANLSLNPQSLLAPHTHIVVYTEKEISAYMKEEKLESAGDRRKYWGWGRPLITLFQEMCYQLAPVNQTEIGVEVEMQKFTKDNSGGLLPEGAGFYIDRLEDFSNAAILNTIIRFENNLQKAYQLLAGIFIENPQDIEHADLLKFSDLSMHDPNHWVKNTEKLVDEHNIQGELRHKLIRAVTLLRAMARRNGKTDLQKMQESFSRGFAYSVLAHPIDHANPQGKWRVVLPIFIFGGGGVESLGIVKKRVNVEEDSPLLIQHQSSLSQRRIIEDMIAQNAQVTDIITHDEY